jgi:hypothetical protein
MKPTKPANAKKVTPPAGWSVVSAYGSLRTFSGVDLVRLEDVHAEMCSGGKPPKFATWDIFNHFLTEAISGPEKGSTEFIPQLYAASAMSYPLALFRDGGLARQDHARPYGKLPELGHVHYEDGTTGGVLYTLAEAALRVWVGDVDRTTDHAEVWRANKTEAEDRKYGVEWPPDEALRKLLGRLAVSHELAHQLWGWGTVGAAVVSGGDDQDTASATTAELQASFVFSSEFTNLCTTRKERKGDSWTVAEKDIVWKEICNFPNRAQGVRAAMAKELGLTDAEAVSKLVRGRRRIDKSSVTVVKDGQKVA